MRIAIASYMARYPLGGMLSWVLQYVRGLRRLGHDVLCLEKAGYPLACYDPRSHEMTDDPSIGLEIVHDLLAREALGTRIAFVDVHGRYHGVDRDATRSYLRDCELFLDMGGHGTWHEETESCEMRVQIDGEPGFTQLKELQLRQAGAALPAYDRSFTCGIGIARGTSLVPTADDKVWEELPHPVDCTLFTPTPPDGRAPFTTVMNWRSYEPLDHDGTRYGHKDVAFEKFRDLPRRCSDQTFELAISGPSAPRAELENSGWNVTSGKHVTRTFDAFREYIAESQGEFGVCKQGFVDLRTGWFSDRSSAYLASGRPVILQDTGWSQWLPTGSGLFAPHDAEEAAAAAETIASDPAAHARAAREIAEQHLDSDRVLQRFVDRLASTHREIPLRRE